MLTCERPQLSVGAEGALALPVQAEPVSARTARAVTVTLDPSVADPLPANDATTVTVDVLPRTPRGGRRYDCTGAGRPAATSRAAAAVHRPNGAGHQAVRPKTQGVRTTAVAQISCVNQRCRPVTSGTVRVPRVGRSGAHAYKLKALTRTIGQGGRVTVRLKLGPTTRRAIRRAPRAQGRVVVRLRISVTDDAGNRRTLAREVALKL